MNFYCKGYRLKMRRILSTVALCLGLAGLTGAGLHYQQFDRSEELALRRARNQLLAKQLLQRRDDLSIRSFYDQISKSPLLTSGVLIQERPIIESVTVSPPGVQVVSPVVFRNCNRRQLLHDFKVSLLVDDKAKVELRNKPEQESAGVRWIK
ncbi:MAG: hypothetical protein P1V97_11595 [Planctomycetota bacterium]|nr:hypothetical protein [Planctomycetota bacterium]